MSVRLCTAYVCLYVNTSLSQPLASTAAKVYLHICIIPIKNVHCFAFVIFSLLWGPFRLIHSLYSKNNECSVHATHVFWVSFLFSPSRQMWVQCFQNYCNQQHSKLFYSPRFMIQSRCKKHCILNFKLSPWFFVIK